MLIVAAAVTDLTARDRLVGWQREFVPPVRGLPAEPGLALLFLLVCGRTPAAAINFFNPNRRRSPKPPAAFL